MVNTALPFTTFSVKIISVPAIVIVTVPFALSGTVTIMT